MAYGMIVVTPVYGPGLWVDSERRLGIFDKQKVGRLFGWDEESGLSERVRSGVEKS